MEYSVWACMGKPVVQSELPGILERYTPEDIFNVDEKGLFYRQAASEIHSL